ncbi:MAG: hypothetical protein ACRD3S_18680, partial [Terracidiphilus sp.]
MQDLSTIEVRVTILFPKVSAGTASDIHRDSRVVLGQLIALLLAGFLWVCIGCGGAPTTKPAPSFSLSVNAASVTLAAGSAQNVTVSATDVGGFAQPIQVTVSGLPSGVTATPSSFTITPGATPQVSLAAAASAPSGTATVLFTGSSGSLTASASLSLTVTASTTASNIDVTTYHYDVGRTGLNPNETFLTPANVNASGFGLLRVFPVDGLVDGQPLYLSNLNIDGQTQNVVYAVTEN